MRRKLRVAILSLFLVFSVVLIAGLFISQRVHSENDRLWDEVYEMTSDEKEFALDRIIVKFKDNASEKEIKKSLSSTTVDIEKTNLISKRNVYSIYISEERSTDEAAKFSLSGLSSKTSEDRDGREEKIATLREALLGYLKDPNVEIAQPSYVHRFSTWITNGVRDLPDDYNASEHWYYDKGNLGQMWQDQDCGTGGSGCGGDNNIVVAVLDSGLAYEDHTTDYFPAYTGDPTAYDFYTASEYNNSNGFSLYTNSDETGCDDGDDDDGNGYIDDCHGLNAYEQAICNYNSCTTSQESEIGHPNDDYGHGTFVTGLISSIVENNAGSISPAPNVSIMPIKISERVSHSLPMYVGDPPSPAIFTETIIYGIEYAISEGADVINMSYGSSSSNYIEEYFIKEAYNNGITLVAAAGNGFGDAIEYPAAYSEVIAVGATDSSDNRANYSNRGSEMDLVAAVGDGSGTGNAAWQQSITMLDTNDYGTCLVTEYTDETSCTTNGYSWIGGRCIDPYNENAFDCITSGLDWEIGDYSATSTFHGIGTSYASPQVSAAAALIKGSANYPQKPSEIRNFLRINTTSLSSGFSKDFGFGLLNFEGITNFDYVMRLIHSGNSRGNTDISDWDYGYWKSECMNSGFLHGLSMNTSTYDLNGMVCDDTGTDLIEPSSSYSVHTFNGGNSRGSTNSGDWDYGYWKGECGNNEYITGTSMKTSTRDSQSILCREYNDDNIAMSWEYKKYTIPGGDRGYGSTAAGDWDYGYWKSQCSVYEMAVGVSMSPTSRHDHGLLCRRYEEIPSGHMIRFYDGSNSRGTTAAGDWAYGRWKGECNEASFVKGTSMNPSTGQPSAMLCKDEDPYLLDSPLSYNVYTYNGGNDRGSTASGDWDFGYWKGECADDEFIAGFSMYPSSAGSNAYDPYSIICKKYDPSKIDITSNYTAYVYYGSEDPRGDTSTGDWNYGNWKGECASNEIMTGVSMNPSTKMPHAILCREYTVVP
ncbi:S8 family serine peptidase [Candidatus Dojkabacteria bacterium]|nr:S8 family serine peptidase [Candidatus Dojkabacteria bacterium]